MSSRRERERTRRARLFVPDLIEIFALSAIAIAQPILDVFGRAPEVFVQIDATSADLWWFAVVVTLVPPLVLVAIEVVVRALLGAGAGRAVHHAIVAGLVALFAVRAIRLAAGIEGASLAMLAVITTVLVVLARARSSALRSWLRFAGFAPLLVIGVFVFASPARSLAAGADAETAEAVEVTPIDRAEPRPPVVVLVLDELPLRSLLDHEGKVDAERFPGFAQLASESTWYRNATSSATHTADAVPAILTGRYPPATRVAPVAAEYPDNLFRLLGNVYRFNVSELDTQLCAVPRCNPDHPDNAATIVVPDETDATETSTTVQPRQSDSALATLLRRARSTYPEMIALHDLQALPSVQRDELVAATTTTAVTTTTIAAPVDIGATPTTVIRGLAKLPAVQPTRFGDWLERIDADVENPQLNLLHLTMPHNPWTLDSDGLRYQTPEDALHLAGTSTGNWTSDPGAAISARQRHLLQLRYVDTLVTALRARLVDLDVWDDATVIVTADHGAGFQPGLFLREWDLANEVDLLGVPMFVHGADFDPGSVVDTPTQSVDIVPTIAALAGVEIPWGVDGVDLAHLPARDRTSHPVGAVKFRDYQRIDVDVSNHLADLLATVPPIGEDGGDDLTILRSGPSGDLIGTPVDSMTVAGDAGGLKMLFPTEFSFAPNENRSVAAFVIAEPDEVGPNELVVMAVDGVIQGTSLTFRDGDTPSRFAILAVPSTMNGGPHDVRFYVLRDDALVPFDFPAN